MLTFLEEFVDFLTSLLKENSKPIKLGDFNILWNSSDHIDTWSLATEFVKLVKFERLSRNIKDIDTKQFKTDLKNKWEITHENANIEEMYKNYIKDTTSNIE